MLLLEPLLWLPNFGKKFFFFCMFSITKYKKYKIFIITDKVSYPLQILQRVIEPYVVLVWVTTADTIIAHHFFFSCSYLVSSPNIKFQI